MRKKAPLTKNKYDCVLFDMDGVIINSIETWIDAGLVGLTELKLPAERKHVIQGLMHFESLKEIGLEDLESYGYIIHNYFFKNTETILPHDNIELVLKTLKKNNVKIGLVTTSGRKSAMKILTRLDLLKYFDITITLDDVSIPKPDPEGVFKALQTLQVDANKTMIVGDTRNDVLAGKSAQITTVLYYPDCHLDIYDKEHVMGLNADHYIADLRELLPIVYSS